ncbi:hypothetical protein SLEP1_g15007 [Rubroshorea leprosula]|uniref:Exostosin GT47 domain-containing protein n=1 Tax=Rubroshorea leprosula TaxID=152421 RepID=A0AAV5IVG5_9ROSI|nr:hypothetical protein SLEP1_g15007 [Rubroshorea leprosula]
MEKRLKVWVYKEGQLPLFHGGPLKDIYGIEGQFLDELEGGKSPFIAHHPDEAHVFMVPVSISNIIRYIYMPIVTYSRDKLQRIVTDYITVVAEKYPYWNRSGGADHFLVSCHDWVPDVSGLNPEFYTRVLCNANTSEGFQPKGDVSIPEIKVPPNKLRSPHQDIPPSKRFILAFFAGGAHGHIRKILFEHWKEKDIEVQVYGYLSTEIDYFTLMARSRFCLCPSGYEVASPRVVSAIVTGCVPVIISDYYALPFSDVLRWDKFSIHIPSAKIPEIKTILKRIPMKKYLKMRERVKQVQRHFIINRPAQPFDMFHMILHSVWLRRISFRLPSL